MTTLVSKILVNEGRLWASLEDMAKIGPGIAGGNNRQTLTDEDAAARQLFQNCCIDAGCQVCVDQVGNMFAKRAGTNPGALPVYVGSHLDTQPTGGRYDGVLGVLAGLEAIRTLNDMDIQTRRPIVVVNWTNEEGCRFAPSMLGSGVFAGVYEKSWAHDRVDADGITFGEELARIGWLGEEEAGQRPIHAYYELHIEQGPILEAEENEIGIVTHGQGLAWLEVTVDGRASHAGSTPMTMRKDAMLGLAKLTTLVNDIALSHSPNAVGTVGRVQVSPNSTNVVPGEVIFSIDFRAPDLDILEQIVARFHHEGRNICNGLGLEFSVKKLGGFDPVTFDKTCVDNLRRAAGQLGYRHRDMVSGAGHDACWINRVAPAAMVMCPCVDGLSHNEAEDITSGWATAGANVLLQGLLHSAEICS